MLIRVKYNVYRISLFIFVVIIFFQMNVIYKLKKEIKIKSEYISICKRLNNALNKDISDKNSNDFHNLSHVVIPFHIKQYNSLVDNIKKWSKYMPCSRKYFFNKKSPKLIFFVSYNQDISVKYLHLNLSDLIPYFRCFSNRYSLDIVKYKLSHKQDYHVLGARLMFEFMLRKKSRFFKECTYIFYMEPDCRPVRSNWINALQNEIGSSNFWIKGAIFRGKFENKINKYLPNKYHINGNAIYNIGDNNFRDFYFKILRPYIERHNDSITAYDTDFSEFFFDEKNYDYVKMIIHKFAFTETIQNLWHLNYSVAEVRKKFPNTFIIHGGNPIGF